MRAMFMGSPTFAVPSLERLLADGHRVPLVVTQPDRPAGRGQALRPPPVKVAALRQALPLLQPERLDDPAVLAQVRDTGPEIIVVVAFGQYLPRSIRDLPPLGCVNVHASLLPKLRGAAPIARALLEGEAETGVTIMRVEGRMDAGPMLLQRRCSIRPDDDAGRLHDRLAALGAEALSEALHLLAAGQAAWSPQDEGRATAAPKILDADCRLDLAVPAGRLVNQVRGLSPVPGAYLTLDGGQRVKVFQAVVREGSGLPGQILAVEDEALVLATAEGALALLSVQPEGKRRMSGAEFARGRRLRAGDRCA